MNHGRDGLALALGWGLGFLEGERDSRSGDFEVLAGGGDDELLLGTRNGNRDKAAFFGGTCGLCGWGGGGGGRPLGNLSSTGGGFTGVCILTVIVIGKSLYLSNLSCLVGSL